ncbi:MAG: Uma2 family endonuclease [Cytophagia bacterium]|nr:MAG: Uma2 family endonuclease [Runella sp.]TAG20278.1 MAG: Uma2 family endonuclease [Cytophagales bacterium]TAG39405.1 MAG: Uma2 family endonuclease [Cytophagia bacterium]TAG80843.1 MAG: Uma2 family endonuclease [Cytophagales bacterium]
MATDLKWPRTNQELAELMGADEQFVFSATLAEYWNLLSEVQYRADYFNSQIIATMSYENDIHSHLAAEFGFILKTIYRDNSLFRVYNSNRPVYIADCTESDTGIFNADGMVVAMPSARFEYKKGMNAEMNPVLLIEILSKSTRLYDFGPKLPCYKNIPSLRQILFVEQNKPKIHLFEREAHNRWVETELTGAEATFSIEGETISLGSIYRNLDF